MTEESLFHVKNFVLKGLSCTQSHEYHCFLFYNYKQKKSSWKKNLSFGAY